MSKAFGTPLTDSKNTSNKFELLQCGDTGSGKTTRSLDATRFGPVFVMDLDGKLVSTANELDADQKKLIHFEDLKSKTMMEVTKLLKEIKAEFDSGKVPFTTLVIDTFTILNEKAYIHAMGKKLDDPKAKATFDEWGVIGNILLTFFNTLHSLPCNIIVNAHVAKNENAEGKTVLGVEGMGSFRNKIAKKMTDSHYLYFEMGKFQIKAAKSAALPANSAVNKKFLDNQGRLLTPSLEIFDERAFKNE